MNLSKIPEPSENDLDNVRWLLTEPQFCMKERVIAHILRHGRVLAAFAKRHGMHRSAVEFFEQCGGNDER